MKIAHMVKRLLTDRLEKITIPGWSLSAACLGIALAPARMAGMPTAQRKLIDDPPEVSKIARLCDLTSGQEADFFALLDPEGAPRLAAAQRIAYATAGFLDMRVGTPTDACRSCRIANTPSAVSSAASLTR